MKIEKLIGLVENKIISLQSQVDYANSVGDVENVLATEAELAETLITLSQLKSSVV